MELIDRIRNDIDSRLEELRPQVEEIPRLESVLAALDAAGGAQTERAAPRTSGGRGRPRSRGPAAATTSRASRPRRRARRGQRREEFLQLVKGHPEITIAEAARQIGVSPPQISTLVRRLEEEGVIQRADGRFVLVAPAASEATSDEVAVIEGDTGSPEADIQGPGVEELAPEAAPPVTEMPPDAGSPVAELPPEGESTDAEGEAVAIAPEAGAREEELAPEATRDEAGRPQAT